jgi:hypothetical protein
MPTDGNDSGALDELLARMPDIAKAVSAFPEGVQQSAFDSLMSAARGGVVAPGLTIPLAATRKPKARKAKVTDGATPIRARRSGGSPSVIRDLDLAPKGKASLKDFVASKEPKSNHDYNAVSVYYLAEVLGLPAVTLSHVFTCYKDMRWREPHSLGNSLSLTSGRKRFLDTANLDDIKLTPAGRNHVEQDLPPKRKAK